MGNDIFYVRVRYETFSRKIVDRPGRSILNFLGKNLIREFSFLFFPNFMTHSFAKTPPALAGIAHFRRSPQTIALFHKNGGRRSRRYVLQGGEGRR